MNLFYGAYFSREEFEQYMLGSEPRKEPDEEEIID